ncbi:glycerol-3-phosphate dehydrogenase [Poseidonocella sp. HB161398]|uniref:glycerol-3-phosphate dehydrogenase n=1 Tax=Poseidonocella sp. HB161398 TaxID=2320855 RepID=UPI001108FD1A|nr:glycerol-3-phosphate dehydrogenase [Poseidonocella sp. HB161398]
MTADLLVIGGGVNGCGIARDAAGRGLDVHLVEQGDLAQATSSASTKLFHGGLRYLEHCEFRLVREALREREVLLGAMPHIARPLRFVLPHHEGLRPAWLLRLGLFLYDHLGGRKILPGTAVLDLRRDPAGRPLKDGFRRAFEYSDVWADDARLVVLNARDAADRGARIETRTRLVAARPEGGIWTSELEDAETGQRRSVTARALVNAAGPWVSEVLGARLGRAHPGRIRLVRGSHIVTRRLFDHDRAYIFQNGDGRIVFAIPYEDDFTCIGTTDVDQPDLAGGTACSAAEEAYLCAAVSDYLAREVTPADVVWRYAGVRPLDDAGTGAAQAATRDYRLDFGMAPAPLLSVFGGKITTYRRLAEAALGKLAPVFPGLSGAWTAGVPLPGGDFPHDGTPALAQALAAQAPWLAPRTARRMARAYGTLAAGVAGDAPGTGEEFGAGLTAREVDWLMDREWARTAEDILWRRSKLGLRIGAEGAARLARYMDNRRREEKAA